jgi:valyl-tRNA synthetase
VEHTAKLKLAFRDFDTAAPHGAAKAMVGGAIELALQLGGLIDPATEKARISKDLGKAEKEISGLEKKLDNADFLARAPEDVVAEQRARLAEEKARKQRLLEALATLGGQP